MRRDKINQNEIILRYENYQKSDKNLMFHQHDDRWLRTNVVREYFKEVCNRVDNHPSFPSCTQTFPRSPHLLESGAIKNTCLNESDTYLHVTQLIIQ